ncbi:MAG TPA: glycosyltransferase [Pyrinomonadaceae bacterium]|nr:glycosyltransferase [Pyrinomonadaceae bacterium]
MKITLCKSHLDGPISGADETLVTYAAQLKKAGLSVSVLLMYLQAEEDQYYQRLLESEVPVSWIASNLTQTSLGAGRRFALRMFQSFPGSRRFVRRQTQPVLRAVANRYYKQCRDFLKKEGPDLVHVMTPNAGANVMIRAAHDANIPVIYQELGIPYHPPGFDYYEEFTSVLPLCSEIAALSPRLIEECREKLPAHRALSVLPIMSQLNGHHESRRSSDGRVTFGFAARMEKLKGPMIMIEALGLASQQNPNICMNIAGDGSQRQKIAARAKTLNVAGQYRYHGVYTHPEERSAFMQSLDVFVMPSFTEGTPNCIVEAMAHGKPIIASEVGGVPDMIGNDAGVLVPPGDVKALTQAMLRLARDRDTRESMGLAARARYERFFSPAAVLPLILQTYTRVSGNGHQVPGAADQGHSHPWAY